MTDNSSKSDKPQKAQIIAPPNSLRDKVRGSGGPTQEMLAKANAAIESMGQDYPDWAVYDVDRLNAFLEQASGDAPDAGENLRKAYKVAHDMRGQGGSFGYPMVTNIADSLCKFIDRLDRVDGTAHEILLAHIKSMRAVLKNRIAGNGGPVGAKILDGLHRACASHAAKTPR